MVARRHDLNANLLFTWRRQMCAPSPAGPRGGLPSELIPIDIVSAPSEVPVAAAGAEPRGVIEIIVAGGVRVRVDAWVDETALRRVLSALKSAA